LVIYLEGEGHGVDVGEGERKEGSACQWDRESDDTDDNDFEENNARPPQRQ
jgi:hypothetical protein